MKSSTDTIAAALDAALSPRPLSYTAAGLTASLTSALNANGFIICARPVDGSSIIETMTQAMSPMVNDDMAEPFKSAWLTDLATTAITALRQSGFAVVPTMPTVEMVAAVVQQVGDPSPEAWALAERAIGGTLGLPNMAGEQACAELVRDWQNMIEATEAGR